MLGHIKRRVLLHVRPLQRSSCVSNKLNVVLRNAAKGAVKMNCQGEKRRKKNLICAYVVQRVCIFSGILETFGAAALGFFKARDYRSLLK